MRSYCGGGGQLIAATTHILQLDISCTDKHKYHDFSTDILRNFSFQYETSQSATIPTIADVTSIETLRIARNKHSKTVCLMNDLHVCASVADTNIHGLSTKLLLQTVDGSSA